MLAGWLRFGHLATVPGGFHGDEAVVGMEAERILEVGSIGPYSPPAQGQPSGPLYLTAVFVRLFGPTVWTVRAVSAFLGTLTIPLFYLLLRRQSGRTVALVGAFLLATLDWHILFSRVAFPLISWPLCAVATAYAAIEATKRQKAWLWGLTGALAGVGIYSYNAHSTFLVALSFWFLFYLFRQREVSGARRFGWLACFILALGIVAIPMARFALDPANDYFSHARAASILKPADANWPPGVRSFTEERTTLDQLKWAGDRITGFWLNLSWRSESDRVDASGVVPVFPAGMLVLAMVGWCLVRKGPRNELMALSSWCVVFLPLGAMLTIEGPARRPFALAPFLVYMCAIGLIEVCRRVNSFVARKRNRLVRPLVPATAIAVVCVVLAGQSLYDYFGQFVPSPRRAWVYVQDFNDTCEFLRTVPRGTHVLFYSDRWSCNYEPRQFLLPRLAIEDRSREFGTFSFDVEPHAPPTLFVLMGLYIDHLEELKTKYPGSRVEVGPPSGETGKPAFIALWPQLR